MTLIISMRYKLFDTLPSIMLSEVIHFLKEKMAFRATNITVCYEGDLNTNLNNENNSREESIFHTANLSLLQSIRELQQIHPKAKTILTNTHRGSKITPENQKKTNEEYEQNKRQNMITSALIQSLHSDGDNLILNYGNMHDTMKIQMLLAKDPLFTQIQPEVHFFCVPENSPIWTIESGYPFNVHYLESDYPFQEHYFLSAHRKNQFEEPLKNEKQKELLKGVLGVLTSFLQKSILRELQKKLTEAPTASITQTQEGIHYNSGFMITKKEADIEPTLGSNISSKL